MLRILLADDHALVRAGIRSLLEDMPGVEVIAEAGDGLEAVRLVEEQQPDLVLMDVAMKNVNGLEATAQIRRQFPAVRVLILSMYTNEDYVVQALRAGASGYLVKDSAPLELELAINAVKVGDTYLSPPVSRQMVESYMLRIGSDSSPLDALTSRQREILQLIAEGRSTKEMAYLLNVSIKTVETHRAQIMQRLNVRDIPGLVRYAIKAGLVNLDT
ncbi:MAG TPA: response regulator transcription factor [Burkholderiales bacterium]|jgi:DNA-binding NarL/FixJ family response regulator|nr:response regulator transcription factor [Burkholderiales bacterium]